MYGDSEHDGAGRCNANSVDPSQVSPNMRYMWDPGCA